MSTVFDAGAWLRGPARGQIIVAQAVSDLVTDAGAFEPVLKLVNQNCGAPAEVSTADAGYWSAGAESAARQLGTDPYVSCGRRKPNDPADAKSADLGTNAQRRMRAKLATPEGKKIYARRKAVVEPVFGQIKEARGFRRFSLRGLQRVQGEWALVSMTHNLLKLWRSGVQLPPSIGAALLPA